MSISTYFIRDALDFAAFESAPLLDFTFFPLFLPLDFPLDIPSDFSSDFPLEFPFDFSGFMEGESTCSVAMDFVF